MKIRHILSNISETWIFLFGFTLIIGIIILGMAPVGDDIKISGAIENVQIVYETIDKSPHDDFLLDTFIGVLFGHPIIGAVIGMDGHSTKTKITQPRSCKLVVDIPDDGDIKLTFDRYVTGTDSLGRCLSSKIGDEVNFLKRIREDKIPEYAWTWEYEREFAKSQ